MSEEQKAQRLQAIKDAYERMLDRKKLKDKEGEENGTEYRDHEQYEHKDNGNYSLYASYYE